MKLQTRVKLKPVNSQFAYADKILLLGSCFAENIGAQLDYYKFQAVTNPFGILFHPLAIEKVIESAVLDKTFTEEDVFEQDGFWKCFDAHSDLNALSRLGAVILLQEAQQQVRNQLSSASHLFITLGTSWVYRYLDTDAIVANCHKVPQKAFVKEILSVDEITQSLSKIMTLVKALNPKINITVTISPVRHLKDGLIENTRSKAHLISAVHQIVDNKSVDYFPAYEIQMDELRDYRFYGSDLLHPSELAIQYIWERFLNTYVSTQAQHTAQKVEAIQKGLAHRPFNPEGGKHQQFLQSLRLKIKQLEQQFDFMKF